MNALLVSRRALLVGVGAAAIAPHIPAATAGPLPTLPCFAVGTPGGYNWRVFFAATAERARAMWEWDFGVRLQGEELCVDDVPHLSGIATEEGDHMPDTSDKLIMGWDSNCDRCHCDVSVDGDNYRDIGGDCVCQDCMTAQEVDAEDHEDFLNDILNEKWDVTDPAIFALLRPEDLLDETILDALRQEAELHPECARLAAFAQGASPEPGP